MNKNPYHQKHLQKYTGILISPDARGEKFKMELKVEDNPVMERWTQKGESAIELEFRYNFGPSTMFFHNIFTCPTYLADVQGIGCDECERIRKIYDIFHTNLQHLQFGDTFSIQAALMKDNQSVLPPEIYSFENYQPLLAACTEYPLRLDETPEGINKRYEREQQKLQTEREAEEKRKEDEERAQKGAKWRKIKENIHDFFGKSPYITQIITSVIGGLISGLISGVFIATVVEPIPNLIRWIVSFL